jgi:hypothetical protein
MCRPKTKHGARAIAGAVAFAALLAGCSSDIYYDRRETVSATGGDAVAANMVAQMVDPWPRNVNNRNIPFNGERMQRAVECYRKDRVTTPVEIDPTIATDTQGQQSANSYQCVGQMSSGMAQPIVGSAIGGTSGGLTGMAAAGK